MKVTIEFDLKRDVDKYEYKIFKQSVTVHDFVYEFRSFLRSEYKYTDHTGVTGAEMLEKVREKFYDLAKDYNVNFEDL